MLTACSAVALTGCGGNEQQVERRTDTTPRIERAIADGLAARSDSVATMLESGNSCGASAAAARLRAELNASVDSIPQVYLEDLSGLVNEIQAQIPPCHERPAGVDDHDHGHGKHKKDKKDKKKHDGDDEGDE